MFLDHAPINGGAEKSLLLLLRHLPVQKKQLHLAAPSGALLRKARLEGFETHSVHFPRLRRSVRAPLDLFRISLYIARIARNIGAGSIYANTVRSAFYGSIAALLARVPFVWHMRDFWLSESDTDSGRFDRLGKRLLCVVARLVISNSLAVKENLPCQNKVHVVHNGIDPGYFSALRTKNHLRSAFEIPFDAPVVGTVGRLRPWKGQDRFLRAMAEVAFEVPEAYFLIVGGSSQSTTDNYSRSLIDLAVDLGIAGRAVFTGHLDDVRPALIDMDVFVHAGDPEPFGLVNLEAMAMELPIVAFSHGALPEIVMNDSTGILLPPGDVQAMAQAVLNLLRNQPEINRLGQSGRQRVWDEFTAEKMALRILDLLKQHGLLQYS